MAPKKKTFKSVAKQTWHFLWYDDSWLSWLANLVLAFVLIKFVIYPLLGLLLGTPYPVVAVVSNSMKHHEPFDDWWEQNEATYDKFNISGEDFEEYRFKNGFSKGDIMILVGVEPEEIEKGDVLVFTSRKPDPIIHRVVTINDNEEPTFHTKGDNNAQSIKNPLIDETRISRDQIIGVAVIKMPFFGWLKIGFVNLVTCPMSNQPMTCFKKGFSP